MNLYQWLCWFIATRFYYFWTSIMCYGCVKMCLIVILVLDKVWVSFCAQVQKLVCSFFHIWPQHGISSIDIWQEGMNVLCMKEYVRIFCLKWRVFTWSQQINIYDFMKCVRSLEFSWKETKNVNVLTVFLFSHKITYPISVFERAFYASHYN